MSPKTPNVYCDPARQNDRLPFRYKYSIKKIKLTSVGLPHHEITYEFWRTGLFVDTEARQTILSSLNKK
jgi:hypothetical protein